MPTTGSPAISFDAGDGTTQVGILTKHKYTAAGTYSVKLTANHGSKSAINTQSIIIAN
jgi:PKD repeat protein